MQNFFKILISVFLYILLAATSNAQKNNMTFRHLTTENGLSQNCVFSILQDRQGFMWFATRDGLNRYDGNDFVVFKNNPDNPWSLSDNFVWDIIEDNKGYLWITTQSGGVNKFDPATERFTHYRHSPNNPGSIGEGAVLSLFQDSRGYLWFGTDIGGLNKFDPSTEVFTSYRNNSEGKFVDRITNITEDKHGDIWFVGNKGLHHLNPVTGKITRPPVTIDRVKSDFVTVDEAGNLWMTSWSPNALVKYDPQSEQLTESPLGAGLDIAGCNMLDDGQKGFWVPTKEGLYHFDRRTGHFDHLFRHDETDPNSLNDNTVTSIYRDRAGLLWLGTELGGINILNFQQQQFGRQKHNPNTPGSLSPGSITTIYEDSNNILWIGFSPRALDRVNRTTGQTTHYLPDPQNANALGSGANVGSIYKDSRGYIWLGGWNSGLDRLDERHGQFKHYRHIPGNPNSLISNDILNVYEDRSGNLWIGQYGGLSHFDRETEKFTNYKHNINNPSSLGHDAVRDILQDHTGILWLGTWGGVLSRFDKKTETFFNYFPDPHSPQCLNGGAIYILYEDRKGTLWIGATDGLYRYNRDNGTFTRYTDNQGLPSSNIQCILEDNKNRLWVSTKNGLSRFDTQTQTFRNYDVSDGLQASDFSEHCCIFGQKGEMFFGGSKGYNAFFPENIRDNSYVPPVVLTDFQLFNMSVPIGENSPLNKAVNVVDHITLNYNQQVFSFKFAALSYNSPKKNQYAFKLEGFDDNWRYTDAENRTATYTRLSPGNYTFRVRASNNDGVWNEQGTSVKITIIPPWWGTWLFRSTLVLFILSLAVLVHFLRVISIKRYNRKLENEVAQRTEQLNLAYTELNTANEELETTNEKLISVNNQLETANKELEAFAYSVSHDLRAPLRGIEGFSQILVEEYQDQVDTVASNYLQRIRTAAQRMEQLIDDMLSLSRVNRTEMVVQELNMSGIVQKISGYFTENEQGRDIEFIIKENVIIKADNGLMQIVLQNLLQNAWKFTSKTEKARIEFGEILQEGKQVLFIKDNGAGFEMKYAQKLFGAFQRLHDNTEFPGTGIGLATVQRIIHRHGGKVWAEGEVNKGATIYFSLP